MGRTMDDWDPAFLDALAARRQVIYVDARAWRMGARQRRSLAGTLRGDARATRVAKVQHSGARHRTDDNLANGARP